MQKSDVFDLAGVCLVAMFAYMVWPPAVLLVVAAACFVASAQAHRRAVRRGAGL